MSKLFYADQLCRVPSPVDWSVEKRELFLQSMKEVTNYHYEHSPTIRAFYEKKEFHPDHVKTVEDLKRIPPLGVTAMKYHLLLSKQPEKAVLKLTSSGTRGQKTQIWFDRESLERVQTMLDTLFLQEGLISKTPTNYLVLSYDPQEAKDLGVAYTEKNQLRFAPVKNVFFALRKKDGEWFFDKEKALSLLLQYEKEKAPVRLFGLPSYLHELIEILKEKKIKLSLGGKESFIITGGGWKSAEKRAITREEFRANCHQYFGIDEEHIRDAFGMAEHSAPYFQCRHHRFHIPVYNHLLIRDPETMAVMPPGERGLLELLTPFNTLMPNHVLLSTDWAMIDSTPCCCGWQSPTFSLLGRSGIHKHKGCALQAEDYLTR